MTDISNRAIIPQVNEPLGYVDGKPLYPTVAWQQFLDALWKRTGGFRDGLFDEVIRSLVEASETRGALASVESLTRALESLAQANDADIRQAIEASRQEASSRIDDARAQTLSSALELIENARREIRAEAESTRAEVQSALAALGELARLDEAARRNIAVGAIGNQGQGFIASHAIRTLPAATPTSTASYTFLTQRTGFFTVPANSTVTLEVSFQFRAPSDLFDWFFYKYALRLEAEGGGTQTLIAAPVATRRKGEWVSGSMAGANYDRVEPFALQFQIASEDIVPASSTGRYRGAFDLEPDNAVNTACAEGWGATVTGTFAWQNVSLTAIAFNDGPIRN
jgi:F0F1-type ATP synthase membrane subunit b/b'